MQNRTRKHLCPFHFARKSTLKVSLFFSVTQQSLLWSCLKFYLQVFHCYVTRKCLTVWYCRWHFIEIVFNAFCKTELGICNYCVTKYWLSAVHWNNFRKKSKISHHHIKLYLVKILISCRWKRSNQGMEKRFFGRHKSERSLKS